MLLNICTYTVGISWDLWVKKDKYLIVLCILFSVQILMTLEWQGTTSTKPRKNKCISLPLVTCCLSWCDWPHDRKALCWSPGLVTRSSHSDAMFSGLEWRSYSTFSNRIKLFLIPLNSILLPSLLSSFLLALESVCYSKVRLKLMCLEDFLCLCSTRLILEGMSRFLSLEKTIYFSCS